MSHGKLWNTSKKEGHVLKIRYVFIVGYGRVGCRRDLNIKAYRMQRNQASTEEKIG